MALDTYFSGPPDLGLGQITQGMLQDQAQTNAANAAQQTYFANLAAQRAAERENRVRVAADLAARTNQTNAYRDVGMREQDVRSTLGNLPYTRMTPAQAAEFALQKTQQEWMQAHPEYFGDPKIREFNAQKAAADEADAKRAESAASLANEMLDSYKQVAKGQVSEALQKANWGHGFSAKEAGPLSDTIVNGGDVIAEWANNPNVLNAKNVFATGMHDATLKTIAQLKDAATLIRLNPVSKRWESVYAKAPQATPPPAPSGAAAPAAAAPGPVTAPAGQPSYFDRTKPVFSVKPGQNGRFVVQPFGEPGAAPVRPPLRAPAGPAVAAPESTAFTGPLPDTGPAAPPNPGLSYFGVPSGTPAPVPTPVVRPPSFTPTLPNPQISYFGVPTGQSQMGVPEVPNPNWNETDPVLTAVNKIAIPFTIWAARNPGSLAMVASNPAAAAMAAGQIGASSAFDAAQEAVTPTPGGPVDQLMGLARFLMQQRQ